MSAPVRWKDADSEASHELRALMEYAHARGPDAAQLATLTSAVLAQLAPPPAAAGSAMSSVGTGAAAWSTGKIGTLIVVAALVGAAATNWYSKQPMTPDANVTKPKTAAPTPRVSEPVQEPAQAGAPETAPDGEAERTAREHSVDTAQSTGRRHSVDKVPAPSPALAPGGEHELLHAARLARRDAPQRALQLLSEHERLFPNSMFGEEREALRIELLQRVDPNQAATRLRAFDARYPQSAYRQRIGTPAQAPWPQ